MNVIHQRMAMIFNEWARRYSEEPEAFGKLLDDTGKPYEDYGDGAAAYFQFIADDMEAKGLLPGIVVS